MRDGRIRTGAVRAGRLGVALLLAPPPMGGAMAQGQPLMPPSLPSTLPGGMPLPGLPSGSQQEILQRILDAAGSRTSGGIPASPAPAAPAPPPASPIPATGAYAAPSPAPRLDPAEPLSNTEAFFAARLPEQQPPLRQFGYDTFRRSTLNNAAFATVL
ncbi:hypothetical protein [Roseomonas indoligenes]|uniref:Uncharacterized protein n=1 Tax=Roseomonas indoligenes TaxID=2820811 RepID=A0A940N0S8_9PROT|nr:hypothetical protein [Pararoseomonas indoligenes]MBP0493981.1 hypothetical protein [Pararoseomonas indoligenes]